MLVGQARRGDGRAFEQLYRWLAGRIVTFGAARGAPDPEGIANETFLRAFRSLDRFEGDQASFRSWIFAIAHNLVVDGHRAAARRPQFDDVAVPERTVAAAETEALRGLGMERMVELMSVLSDDQRAVILLRMVGDLSLDDVAFVVEKPITAVKALQRRGLRRLQSRILAEVAVP